jgi:endonuclease I
MKTTMKKLSVMLLLVLLPVMLITCYDSGDSKTEPAATNPGSDNPALEAYYTAATGLTGQALKDKLHQIINTGLTRHDYDSCWEQIKYIHEDPANTNNIILIYTGYSIPKAYMGSGAASSNNDYWNREHVWAQSHGNFGTGTGPGTDLHHLMPCDISLNSSRGNLDFDIGGTAEVDNTPTEGNTTYTGCKKDGNSFEPRDADKGDIARMLFYMAVMYENKVTSANDTIDLELNNLANGSQSGSPAYHGYVNTLKAWHAADPVDDWERRRNSRTFDVQKNRNPFIDHPEWVSSIWGN